MKITVLALALGLCAVAPVASALAAEKPAAAAKPAAAGAKYDEAKLTALEAKLAKKPKDVKLKQEVAEANFQVGFLMMNNPDLPPRMKYPGALKKYNRALELNPKHAEAAKNKKMIEDIYKSMGRPIPG